MKLSLARSLAHSLALLRSPTVQRLNPIYGQGITVAAQSAITLARCLERAARADVQIRDFSRMYVRDLYRSLENSWSMATASDLRFPSTSLAENNVARPTAFERAVTDSLLDMAQTDPKLYLKLAFFRARHGEHHRGRVAETAVKSYGPRPLREAVVQVIEPEVDVVKFFCGVFKPIFELYLDNSQSRERGGLYRELIAALGLVKL